MSLQHLSEDSIVEAHDLHFAYSDRPVFDGLNLSIPRGKVTVIMGPSGCGKSTFLSLLGGRLVPDKGRISFDGTAVPSKSGPELYAMRRKMGMLFQKSALLTDLNVFDNVAFPFRETTRLPEALIRIQVLTKLQMVGLRGACDMQPSELSGGMARRVALARAIALDPLIIMYDEPFVGLDPISMGIILKLIRNLNDVLNLTSIVVTHDVTEGCEIADYVYLLDGGRVSGSGTPEQLSTQSDPAIEQFMQGLADGPVGFHYPAKDYLEDLAG
ncbi:MAG: ATP-binding cassette domain-containing protein [Gammaproteobacteria bacterium]|nr:ATP-binding cassette domain-containing protein [Gammaproteobacteria bacterium]MYD76714.1 ATP-binding cassette domain-containing protein [Gammaproteobacteria bacterium]MYJ51618.1 ATP-binding cassette domain-containing protein [Gammaproteobacteria bacterium]